MCKTWLEILTYFQFYVTFPPKVCQILKNQSSLSSLCPEIFGRESTNFYETPVILTARGRHHKRYSVIAITPRYVFALLHNALYLWRTVIASYSYRFRLSAGFIAYEVIALSLRSALSLHVVIVLSYIPKRYRFQWSNGVNLAITLPGSRVIFLTVKDSKEPCYFCVIV